MNSATLLDLLTQRYAFSPAQDATQEQLRAHETWAGPIRLRVINVIRKWVEHHYYFEEDPSLAQVLRFILIYLIYFYLYSKFMLNFNLILFNLF